MKSRKSEMSSGTSLRTRSKIAIANQPVVESMEGRTLMTANIAGFSESTYGTNLTQGTAMEFAPDGRIFVTTQTGQIRIVKNGQTLPTPFASVVTQSDVERGLLGITLDPNFSQNGFVYIYYTAQTPTFHNRISRFTADPAHPDVALAGSEHVLMDLPTVASPSHNSGSLHFGPDGKLYVSVGENAVPAQAQQQNSIFGKILRINKDGTIPTDNPFYNSNTGVAKAVWAMGLRNPFTFGFQSGTGKMYINDVGQDTWEEINLGKAGANYGWPVTEGPTSNAAYTSPLYWFDHLDSKGVKKSTAIAGAQFYNPPAGVAKPFPSSYTGKYFFGDAPSGTVSYMDPANPGTETVFASNLWYVVDVDLGPDGSLYVLSRGGGYSSLDVPGRIQKFTYTGSVAPSIGTNPGNVLVSEGDSATFSVDASGTGLTYQWQKNKANIQGATGASYKINVTTAADNGAKYRVIVTNSAGSATSTEATLTVSSVAAPTPFITLPATGTHFVSGQPVSFSGGSGDGVGGTLPSTQLNWSISYFTGTIERPFIESVPGVTSGQFTPGTITPYLLTDVSYRVRLTATNSAGVTRSTFVDVLPTVVNITMASNIPGAQLSLSGVPVTAGYTTAAVAGLDRPITAPLFQTISGVNYEFESWSDGGAAEHTASTPTSNVTYTAQYKVSTKQTITKNATKDAYIRDGQYATQNFGAAADLQVRNEVVGWNRNSYLSFDLTGVGAIAGAKLRLYAKLDNLNTPNTSVALYEVTSAWTEAGLTYNNKPSILTTPLGSFTVANTTAKYYEIDLTEFLKAKKAAGATSVEFKLESGVGKSTVIIASDEAAANRPELVILADGTGNPNPDPDPDPNPDPGTPTTVTLHAAEDAHVRDGSYAGQNFGVDTNLQVKNDVVGWNRETYLKFNLGTLGDITSAKIRLNAKLDNIQSPSVGLELFDVSGVWSEAGLNFNNKPGTVGAAIGTFTVVGTTAKYYEIDLTAYLQAKKAAGATMVEIAIKAPVASKSTVLIASDESATNKPELVIVTGSVGDPNPGDPNPGDPNPSDPNPAPTPAHLRTTADTYVRDGSYASVIYGPYAELQVKNHAAVGYTREAYLHFDLSSITSISSAKLRMFGGLTEAGSVQAGVFAASSNSPFDENTFNWNLRTGSTGTALATAVVASTQKGWYEWDLSTYLAAEKAAGKTQITLVLRNLNQSDATLVFASDEAAANRPELVIA